MKHIVILGDGMADFPLPQLDNKTPLMYAKKPNMDFLASNAKVGMVKTVPDNLSPGSDVANLSVMGYDTNIYYTGRSPLEAVSMGINLSDKDITFRCNLVTLSEEENYDDKVMVDYSSDEISTEESRILIDYINNHFKTDKINYYPGISYRHCMVWDGVSSDFDLTPPHDILERNIKDYLPKGNNSSILLDMMKKSYQLLKDHPINIERIKKGLRPANSIWLWGEGKKPQLADFHEKYGLKGVVISAVDLIKGIGICANLEVIEVQGATGNIHTNFSGKAQAAIDALESGNDFVYLHIEAPDECGHQQDVDNKVKSIEIIDEKVLGPIKKALDKYDDYKILLLPDHPTPLSLRTHTSDPVPFVLYQKTKEAASGISGYDEEQCSKTGIYINEGYKLMDMFING